MDGFVLFDAEYHELNEAGLPVVHTSNSGTVVPRDATATVPAYFGFKCPRGQGNCHYLRIRGGPVDDGKRPTWQWNGDYDRPTLTPSINCLAHNPQNSAEKYAGCGWHGWITDGQCKGA
jgi:hypothetical protein